MPRRSDRELVEATADSLAHQLYRIMTQSGYANKDFAVAFKFLQEMEKKH